jgi:long-chain fatty acid transport protein
MRTRFVVAELPLAASLAALLLDPATARASGFHIDEQDARSTGRAGAVTANPTNASTIYYNPAGVGDLQGFHADVGVSFVAPSATFRLASTGAETSAKDQVFPLPQAYMTYRLNEIVGIGLGFNAPFGLSISWPDTSPGRTNTRAADLRSYFITPTVGFSLSSVIPGLSFGAGLDLVPASVKLSRDILFGTDVGSVALGGTAFGAGARAGLLYRPKGLDQWSFGVTYRSPVKLSFSGTADFDADPIFRSSLPPDGDAKTSIVLPQTLDVGVAFNPMPEWQLEVDANWLGWSSYDRLFLELPGNTTSTVAKNWKDSYAIRFGTEYTLDKRWSGRLGFVWDPTPIPDTTLDFQLPDANRYVVTAGIGAALHKMVRADLGVMYILPVRNTTSNVDPYQPTVKGRFDVQAWVIGLSVGFTLPTPGNGVRLDTELGPTSPDVPGPVLPTPVPGPDMPPAPPAVPNVPPSPEPPVTPAPDAPPAPIPPVTPAPSPPSAPILP